MPATLGITSDWDLAKPTGSVVEEQTREKSLEIKTIRNESGVTCQAQPSAMTSTVVSIKGRGAFDLSTVAGGSLTSGELKVKSAKNTQVNDDFPSFEATGVSYA